MKRLIFIISVLAVAVFGSQANAAEIIGRAAAVHGSAEVIRGEGGSEPLAFNTPIYLDDTIVTHAGSSAQIIVEFNTMLSLGPGAEASIKEARSKKRRRKNDAAADEGFIGIKIVLAGGTARVTVNRAVLNRNNSGELMHDVFIETPQGWYDLLEGENNDLVIVLPPATGENEAE